MSESKEVLQPLEKVTNLSVIIVDTKGKVELHFQTDSGQLLFKMNPNEITLFRHKLDEAIDKEFAKILRLVIRIRTKSLKKELIDGAFAAINKRRFDHAHYINFQFESVPESIEQKKLFENAISESSGNTLENLMVIWEQWAKAIFNEQFTNLQKALEKSLVNLLHPKEYKRLQSYPEKRLRLGKNPDDKKMVRLFVREMKKKGYMVKGDEDSFIKILQSEEVDRSIIIDLWFPAKYDFGHFFNGLKKLQASIVFPNWGPIKNGDNHVPWQFLRIHFYNRGQPIDRNTINNSKGRMPDYILDLIKILHPAEESSSNKRASKI